MAIFMYFAYGSNLLRERLAARCLSAKRHDIAVLADHRLTFDKISTDGSGKCGFKPAAGETLPGVVWEIDISERPALDRAERVGYGYDADEIAVADTRGQTQRALTYRATRCDPSLAPYDWYRALVLAGAMQQGLPQPYIEHLRAVAVKEDPKPRRGSRIDALKALADAGYGELLR
jgi:hypothetical protein